MNTPILILSAVPGSGKTTLARELCKRFEKGVHVEGDLLRTFVVQGFAPPIPRTEESDRQFLLMAKNAAMIAENYANHGFFVVIDDVVGDPTHYVEQLGGKWIFSVFLRPAVEVILSRNEARSNKDFDPRVLNSFIQKFHAEVQGAEFISKWDAVIDNSELSVEETADLVLELMKVNSRGL